MKNLFLLDPKVTFLNHGSYGACPASVFEDYQSWQKQLEQQPVQFLTDYLWKNLKSSRQYLGQFINCSEKDILLFKTKKKIIKKQDSGLDDLDW